MADHLCGFCSKAKCDDKYQPEVHNLSSSNQTRAQTEAEKSPGVLL